MMTILRRSLLILLAALPMLALAAPSAHEVIQQTTDELLADLKANKDQYRQDPNAFYASLNDILGPVVDAGGISRSIMTVKYSRNANAEQMNRFQESFKRSLMQFYGNALLEYNNQQIRVLPPSGRQDPERTSVGMEVTGRQGEIYPVSYTMVKHDGEWLVRNVTLSGGGIEFFAMPADARLAAVLACEEGAALFAIDRTTWTGATPITAVRLTYAPGYRMVTAI